MFQYQISQKSVHWEQLFHVDIRTDRRTDMMKLVVAFCNFVKAPKNILG